MYIHVAEQNQLCACMYVCIICIDRLAEISATHDAPRVARRIPCVKSHVRCRVTRVFYLASRIQLPYVRRKTMQIAQQKSKTRWGREGELFSASLVDIGNIFATEFTNMVILIDDKLTSNISSAMI